MSVFIKSCTNVNTENDHLSLFDVKHLTCERVQNKFGAILLYFLSSKHICGVMGDSFILYQSHQIDDINHSVTVTTACRAGHSGPHSRSPQSSGIFLYLNKSSLHKII